MIMDKLKQAILDTNFEKYDKCYIGPLEIKEIKPFGYDVALGFDRFEAPLHIAAQLEWNDFLTYFKKELSTRHLSDIHFYTGYKTDTYDQPHRAIPINHACHNHHITNSYE